MAELVLRSVKGVPLSIEEADANFTNLNTEVGGKLDATEYTAADVLAKLLTVDGTGSGLDADTLDGNHAETANEASRIVARDENGDFAAGTITAETAFVGDLTGNVVGDVTGNVSGNATNVSGIVALANGGTGATTAATARTSLGLGSMSTQNSNNVSITGGTISGLPSPVTLAAGGTGAINATQARTNLGLVLGADVQPFDNDLSSLANLTTTGILVRTGSGTSATRTVTAGNSITLTNANGVSGDITVGLSTTPTVNSIVKSGTNGVGDIGSSGNKFGTIYGVATSAQYADLAEKYLSDEDYPVGTVMMVGGTQEVTASKWGCRAIGVVSENPAFRMNEGLEGGTFIALKGRVPVRIIGVVRKGDLINASAGGVGSVSVGHTTDYFGIALETNGDAGEKLVECVIL